MVYALDIAPAYGYYVGVELLDGDRNKVTSREPVNDGGVGWYGTPADPTYLPKHVRWEDRKGNPVPDFDAAQLISVSERAKAIIERFEPGTHQFFPVEFVDKQGKFLENRYWFFICNRLDSVDRDHTTMVLYKGVQWNNVKDLLRRGEPIPPHIDPSQPSKKVFSLKAIGATHMWVDKHTGFAEGYISDAIAEAFAEAGLTGIRPEKMDAI